MDKTILTIEQDISHAYKNGYVNNNCKANYYYLFYSSIYFEKLPGMKILHYSICSKVRNH